MHTPLTSFIALALLLVSPLAALTPSPAHADPTTESDAFEQLLENVRYWQARGRPDKAAEAWRKVLRSVPNHAEALAELALFSARAGRNDEARALLERLKKAHPNHPRVPSLEAALGLGAQYDDLLSQARAAVKAGKRQDGLALYRKVFAGQTPTGIVALEYYQTLGGTDGGWAEARTGLERLVSENPNDPRYAVAFARHLTYVEDTRRDGIDRLEQLASSTDGKAARVAWRQALLWLLIGPADFPRYTRYLAQFPDDAEVKTKVDEVKAGVIAKQAADLGRERLKAGYNALDLEAVDQAEGIFKTQLLENPRDVDALTGLGNAQLRKERFAEAISTFEKVKELAPRRRDLWENAIRTATFWKSIREAEALRKEGRPAAAEPIVKAILATGGPENHHAKLLLAHLYVDLAKHAEARVLFEELVASDPKHVPALRGLVDLYLRSGDEAKALATNARLAMIDPDAAMSEGRIRAELLYREALALRERGQLPEAEGLLDAAFANDPTHLEVLLAQAYVYLDLGKLADARRVVDMARRTTKDEPRVTIAEVWVCAGEQRFADGLALLSTLKDHELDPGTRGLERRLRVEGDVRDAVKQASRGKLISAQARLTELQRATRDAPQLMGLVANGWADIGKFDQALATIYEAITASKKDTPTLKLQLAGILHKANREHELVAVLRELETDGELTPPERRGLANLKIAYAVRRADVAREAGHLARAFSLLQEPLREYPEDPRLMTALGRLFLSAREFLEADELFARVLSLDPESLEARQGAIQSAVEMGRRKRARELAEQGVALAPDDARMHLAAGRMHVLLGEDGDAIDAFERALALEDDRATPTLEADTRVSRLLAGAEARFGSRRQAPEDVTLRSEISYEIDKLRARHSVRIGTSARARHRPGLVGLGEVLALDFPTWVSFPTGYRGRLTFTATPVLLDAGQIDLADELAGERFGTAGIDLSPLERVGAFPQDATGIELSLREEIGPMRFELGVTPLGFPRQHLVGGLTWNESFGAIGLRLEGYRRAVTESLLSWAGATDVATETLWGGVTKNGGRLDLGLTVDNVIWYLVGGGNYFLGERVQSNWSIEGGTGLVVKVYDWEGFSLRTGLDLTTQFFDHNLRHFTFGHGGYFSPQALVAASFPLHLAETSGPLTYDLKVGLGLVWFKEDDAPYYPTDPERQAAREALIGPDAAAAEGFHPGQDALSFAFNLDGELAYALTDGLSLGVRASIHTGLDFEEYQASVFLGYAFQRKVESPRDRMPLGRR